VKTAPQDAVFVCLLLATMFATQIVPLYWLAKDGYHSW